MEVKGPFLILEFNESVDTYDVVSLKFAEPENELCQNMTVDLNKG